MSLHLSSDDDEHFYQTQAKHLRSTFREKGDKEGNSIFWNYSFLNIFLLFSIFCFTIHMTNLTDKSNKPNRIMNKA